MEQKRQKKLIRTEEYYDRILDNCYECESDNVNPIESEPWTSAIECECGCITLKVHHDNMSGLTKEKYYIFK